MAHTEIRLLRHGRRGQLRCEVPAIVTDDQSLVYALFSAHSEKRRVGLMVWSA